MQDSPHQKWPRRMRLALVLLYVCVAVIVLCLASPVSLGPAYHSFADHRKLIGITNSCNVLSNIPFMIVGLWGVVWLRSRASLASFVLQRERIPYFTFFSGVFFTGIGSFWYHLGPTNSRLPWDLLPMTCSFLSMTAAVVMERISLRAGLWLLPPLLLFGAASVVFWFSTEMSGHGDYRFYLFVQFVPPLLLALIVVLFPPRYTRTDLLVVAFLLFALAKVFEQYDQGVFAVGGIVSGHSLKHVTAAISCYWILRMLQQRRALRNVGVHLSSISHTRIPESFQA
jgi:hypothetical protein